MLRDSKLVLALLAVAALFLCGVGLGTAIGADREPDWAVQVRLNRQHENDLGGWEQSGCGGSGTTISSKKGKSYILTCRHGFEEHGDDFHFLVRNRGKTYRATLEGLCQKADLALLSVEAELPHVDLAEKDPKAGDRVVQYGFPNVRTSTQDGRLSVIAGPVKPKVGKVVEQEGFGVYDFYTCSLFLTSYRAEKGDSGAAVLNRDGRVVGVCVTAPSFAPKSSGCVPVS